MLVANHLNKIYSVKRHQGFLKSTRVNIEAVKDVSLNLEKGRIVGLLGINGAGKTTTIKMLTSLLEPTSGEYSLDGIDGIKNPTAIKKKVNMIAGGERMIYWRLTARENLMYYGKLYGVDSAILKKRSDELLDMVGLTDRADDPVETYSKGMKQRLQIARGLINNPEYIFMDEPTIGLDTVITKELHTQIRQLAGEKEKGILLTSHYLNEVEELCDYIYILSDGRLIKQGTVKELSGSIIKRRNFIVEIRRKDGFEKMLCQTLTQIDSSAKIDKADSLADSECFSIDSTHNLIPAIATLILKEGAEVKRLQEIEPSLEDTILHLNNL